MTNEPDIVPVAGDMIAPAHVTRHRLETEFMSPPVDADETSDAALTVYYGISGGR
jgi:hypothetical protein